MGKRGRRKERDAVEVAARHDFDSSGMLGHDGSTYAVNVTERTALMVDAVFACVVRLADAISGGDVGTWRGTSRLVDHALVRRPDASMYRGDWLWLLTATLALYSAAYLRRRGERFDGSPLDLEVIVPTRITNPTGRQLVLDGLTPISRGELFRVRRAIWPTVTEDAGTVLRLARDMFAAAWAQGSYTADYWESGGTPVTQITTDQPIDNTEATLIRERYVTVRQDNPGHPIVIGKGAKISGVGADLSTISDPGTDRIIASIARWFGMQPWMVNAPSAAGSMVYSNTEAAGLDLVRYTLNGYRRPIEDAWSDALPGDYLEGQRVRIGLDHLTLPSFLERAQAYAILTGNRPIMRVSEVRPSYGLPPDDVMDLDPAGTPAPDIERIPEGV